MTEYWVSNAKHHCKFCKCWLQGDKASIRHHENGSRHREAVAEFLKAKREAKREADLLRDEQAEAARKAAQVRESQIER